jgi:H+/Cl- antiporter ClcA
MHKRTWKTAAIIGLLTGLAVSATMTVVDWRLNPGGIFHDELGTDWSVVSETVLSWLWPIALVTFLAALVVLYAVAWVRNK